jgi:hypothetical protein
MPFSAKVNTDTTSRISKPAPLIQANVTSGYSVKTTILSAIASLSASWRTVVVIPVVGHERDDVHVRVAIQVRGVLHLDPPDEVLHRGFGLRRQCAVEISARSARPCSTPNRRTRP